MAVDRTPAALTRFANSVIHQNVAEDVLRIAHPRPRRRPHGDRRRRRSPATRASPGSSSARSPRPRVAPLDAGWPGVAPPAPLGPRGAGRPGDARRLARRPGGVVARRSSTPPAAWRRPATAAPNHWRGGVRQLGRPGASRPSAPTSASPASPAATAPTASARLASGRLADIDGAVLGARAAAKANAAADPVELPPDRYEVVLEPSAVADILEAFSMYALQRQGGRRAALVRAPRRGPVRRRRSRSSTTPRAPGWRGTPTARRRGASPLVDGGTTVGLTHDRRTAAAAGDARRRATASARRRSAPSPATSCSPASAPGGPTAEVDGPVVDSSAAALVAGVERGVLVSDFWYTRVLDPRTLAADRPDAQRRVADRGRRGHPRRCATSASPSPTPRR